MASKLGPISAGRMLRTVLRRAREVADLSQSQVAEELSWSLSKIARIENGNVGISDVDLRALCAVLGVGSSVTEELLGYSERARQRGWWHEFRAELPQASQTLIGLETEAD